MRCFGSWAFGLVCVWGVVGVGGGVFCGVVVKGFCEGSLRLLRMCCGLTSRDSASSHVLITRVEFAC